MVVVLSIVIWKPVTCICFVVRIHACVENVFSDMAGVLLKLLKLIVDVKHDEKCHHVYVCISCNFKHAGCFKFRTIKHNNVYFSARLSLH